MRLGWLEFRRRIYAVVREAGYADLQPVHVILFRYPTIEGLRPTQLAEQVGISKQGVNDLLRQLETKGYVKFRPDPSDGRARLVTLTERGAGLMAHVAGAAQEVSDDYARVVGSRRLEAFRKTLLDLTERS